MEDMVNHPSHYANGKIEVIDFIEDKELNYHRGNAVKYIARAGKKKDNGMSDIMKEIQDLEKAVWYINREINRLKSTLHPIEKVEE
jgi:DNA-binding ferritin-like protein